MTKEHAQINNIRQLALTNYQIRAFKDVLSDLPTMPSSDLPDPTTLVSIRQTAERENVIEGMLSTAQQKRLKWKAKSNEKSEQLRHQRAFASASNRAQSPTPPSIQMELIWPGKQTVKVTVNAVENTPSKRIKAATSASVVENSPSAKRMRDN